MRDILKIGVNYANARAEKGELSNAGMEDLHRIAAVAYVTFVEYVNYWESLPSVRFDKKDYYERDFQWVGKEIPFEFYYELPNGRKVLLKGKKDGVFNLNRQTEGKWLLENKTKGDIDEDGIRHGLKRDLQTGLYLTALQHQSNGVVPKGFLYNVIRRTRLKPRVADTPKSFADRVQEDIQKRPEFYFMRWDVKVDQYDIDNFKRTILDPSLHQLITWWDSIKKKPMDPFVTVMEDGKEVANLEHFERAFGCYDSMGHSQRGEYFEIITDNNYHNYKQAEHVFPELEMEDDLDTYLTGV
jgi:hypothetical protein